MSTRTTWLSPSQIDISGTARPHTIADENGIANDAAAITIASQYGDSMIVIEGRPDELIEKAREILRAAELVSEQTMADPALRRLYGIVTSEGARISGVSLTREGDGLGSIERGEW